MKTAIDETTVSTHSSTKTQMNKPSQQRNLVSSYNYISFSSGSGKTSRVKKAKWQKASGFDKQAAFLAINIDLLKFWPILVDVVICRREQGVVTNSARWHVKEEKSKSNFCIYIINNCINCIFVSLRKIYFWWFIPNWQEKSCGYL